MRKVDITIGKVITHYCLGTVVEGTVIEINEYGVRTEHRPLPDGDTMFTETFLMFDENGYIRAI